MASQPLNTTIKVYQRVRAQREINRYDSVKNIIGRLRPLIAVVPGEEVRTAYGTRTSQPTDFSPFMGSAAAGATRGLPITVGPKAAKDFKTVAQLAGVDFPVEIGQDKFVQETEANAAVDLFTNAKNAQ